MSVPMPSAEKQPILCINDVLASIEQRLENVRNRSEVIADRLDGNDHSASEVKACGDADVRSRMNALQEVLSAIEYNLERVELQIIA